MSQPPCNPALFGLAHFSQVDMRVCGSNSSPLEQNSSTLIRARARQVAGERERDKCRPPLDEDLRCQECAMEVYDGGRQGGYDAERHERAIV